jgi:hypothetical protein
MRVTNFSDVIIGMNVLLHICIYEEIRAPWGDRVANLNDIYLFYFLKYVIKITS